MTLNTTKRYLAVKAIERKLLSRVNLWVMPQDEFDAIMRAVKQAGHIADDINGIRSPLSFTR